MIELVKNTKASLTVVDNADNVELKSTMLKGDKGGYYIPTVEDGVLSWTPTEEEMPQIESTDLISVNSVNGQTGDITGLATEIYVDEAVANESTERDTALNNLKNELDTALAGLAGKDEELVARIDKAVGDFNKSDNDIITMINNNQATNEEAHTTINQSIGSIDSAYKEADLTLQNKINAVDTAFKEADTALQLKVDTVEAEYKEAIAKETESREENFIDLEDDIEEYYNDTMQNLSLLAQNISDISVDYKEADSNIEKRIEEEIARASSAENTNALAIVNLQNEDINIQNRLDAEVRAREEAHTAIKADCKAENDAIKVLIGEETERALAAEGELQSNIEAETANRDKAIKAAIDAIPEVDLTPYAKKAEIPTKVSAFENDKGYLTEHQSLDGYATEDYVANAIDAIPDVDLTPYAKTSYVDEKVASIVDTAPEALNTLNELSAALGDDPNFATTVSTEIGKKVDKVDGKELSSNDFTDAYKSKLDGIAANANKYEHPATHPASIITGLSAVATSGSYADLSNTPEEYTHPETHPASMITGLHSVATSGNYNELTNKPTIPAAYTHPATHPATMITGLSTVATSGSYNDLSNKPTIPSAYTHPATHPASMITGLATVATSGKYSDLSGKPTILSASNNGYNGAITAGGDGVAEMGKYIDFHNTSDGTSDYSTRLVCTGEYGNTVNLPSIAGTLTVGDKQYKIIVSSSTPTTTDTSIITFVV